MTDEGWRDAERDDVAQAIHYALRFDLTGKAHGKRARKDDQWMAAHVVAHLVRANFRIQCGPPRRAHSTSDLGRNPGGMPEGWNGGSFDASTKG